MKLRQRIITFGMAAMLLGGTVTTASILPGTVINSTVGAAITGQTYLITAPDWLALRSGDSTGYSLLKKIPKGRIVTVTKYNSSGTWGYTYFDGSGGWICLKAYAKKYNPSTTNTNQQYQITAPDYLWLRNADTTNGTALKKIPRGAIVTVTKYNSSKTWGYTCYDGQPGFICLQAYAKPYKVNVTVESKIKSQQQAVKNYALNKVGTRYTNGMCLGFVESVYVNTGFNRNVGIKKPGNDCAYHSAVKWRKSAWKAAKSWANGGIPIGATVYIDNNSYCGVKCKTHKTWCDHVGIYVGSGYVVHASGGVIKKEKLTKWGNMNVSWGFAGVSANSYSGNSLSR